MTEYWKAVSARVLGAAFDVLIVALISLAPVLLGRLVNQLTNKSVGSYFDFLTNGQLAFYSMGSLATLLVLCFSESMGKISRKVIGTWCAACLLFSAALVGFDPTLNANSYTIFGKIILIVYVVTLLVKIYVDAVKSVDGGQLSKAATKKTNDEIDSFKERMRGRV